MAESPAEFTGQFVELTIAAGKVASDLTDFPVRVDLSDFAAGWWTNVLEDGGNIRVKDSIGNTLAADLVSIDTGTREGILFFKAPSLLSASDNVFYVWAADDEVALPFSDPDGRHAVWSDYDGVWIFETNADRSGNGKTANLVGGSSSYNYNPVAVGSNINVHQGVAWDGTYFYALDTLQLQKYTSAWATVGSPFLLSSIGTPDVNHFGDGCVKDGILYVVYEKYPNSPYDNQHVALIDTATMTLIDTYDISAQGHEVSSICWDPVNEYFVVTDYTDPGASVLHKYDEYFNYLGTISTVAINKKQGITYYNNRFYITCAAKILYSMALDGTNRVIEWQGTIDGFMEGIDSKGDGDLFILFDGVPSAVRTFSANGEAGIPGWLNIDGTGHALASSMPRRTTWTMGASIVPLNVSTNGAVLSYTPQVTSNNFRASLVLRGLSSQYGIWNSTDTWLMATGVPPSVGSRHRLHHTQATTANRKIWVNGELSATDTGTAQRPGTSGSTMGLYIGAEDADLNERMIGSINYVYLRNGELSANWIAAEYASWEGSDFYAVVYTELPFTADFTFTWDSELPDVIEDDFGFSWSIPLVASRRFDWDLSNVADTFDHQFHIRGARRSDRAHAARTLNRNAAKVNDALVYSELGAFVPISPTLFSDVVEGVGSYHFYGDFYERIWIDPVFRRIPNPRLNVPYTFTVWNAFSEVNELQDVTNIDLPGVELDWASGTEWGRYQIRTLEYTITNSAPASVDGSFFLEFLYGEGSTRLVALVIDVLRTQPNEPMQEVWQWSTALTSSYGQVEQRSALREHPRVMVRYVANLADAEERLRAYRQLYSFISRSVLVPMFQYTTPLEEFAAEGTFELKFDLSIADVRQGEYVVLFNKDVMAYELYQAFTITADGITVENPLANDRGEGWEVLPTRLMRLPDASGLSMGAINGDLTVAGESVTVRALERPASVSSYPVYDGELIIPDKPVAVDNLPEAFRGGVEVLDNITSNPQTATSWDAPMVQIDRFYQIDRDTDMDYWKAIFAEIKGRHRSFLLPTWRDDLPLAEAATLGDSFLITSNSDVVDYFSSQAYRYLQIESQAGVIYRRINAVESDGENAIVTLNSSIGESAGANIIRKVSYVYRVRMDSDEVVLQHYRNWSILELKLRTTNQ